MDVGLVCDRCDAFNAMAASICVVCGTGLTLGAMRRAQSSSPANESTQAKGSTAPTRTCKECGSPVQPGFRFCGSCGAPFNPSAVKPAGERRTQYFSALQQARAKLVLIKGDGLDGVS